MRQIILYIHSLSAVTWIGGIIFLAVIGPFLRSQDPTQGRLFLRTLALRFRDLSWIAVILLVITGVINLFYWRWVFVPILHVKLLLVVLMILVKVLHDFVVGPKASAKPDPNTVWWKGAMFLGRLNLLLGLVVLYLALLL